LLISRKLEDDEASEALPLLRGVIHECHRFLLVYEDPSVIFMNRLTPSNLPSPSQTINIALSDLPLSRGYSRRSAGPPSSMLATTPLQVPRERKW
jgi:hypothetical protein